LCDIRTRTVSAEQQGTITRDSVTVKLSAVLWYRVTDAAKLSEAAQQMANNPVALELRRMQMVTEVGAENSSTTVLMILSDFISLSKSIGDYLRERTGVGVA
jgi:regulator of protease activity HflC (stomatin/prohibitin superfamily)